MSAEAKIGVISRGIADTERSHLAFPVSSEPDIMKSS
jgi:hypothetical protein